MARPARTQYICANCGAVCSKWQGRCESCGEWNTMPGEDPETLPDPSEIVPHLVEMASADFARTNVVFEYPAAAYSAFPGSG